MRFNSPYSSRLGRAPEADLAVKLGKQPPKGATMHRREAPTVTPEPPPKEKPREDEKKGEEENPTNNEPAGTTAEVSRERQKKKRKKASLKAAEENDTQLDPVSAHKDMETLMSDYTFTSDDGRLSLKVCYKPQSKRNDIVVMMCKEGAEGKWKQRLQLVVKPPLLVVDAMIILKFVGTICWMGGVQTSRN